MAKFEIVENHPKWDQFVEKLECPSPFANSSFLKLVDTCYDGQSFTLSVVSSGNIFMGAALRKVGRHIRPAPPMTYMPLIYDKLSHRTLLDAQIALGEYLKKNFFCYPLHIGYKPFFRTCVASKEKVLECRCCTLL